MVHGGGQRHRTGQERLHLVGAEAVVLQPERQIEHVFIGRARMGGNEVRNQILLLARFLRKFLEQFLESLVSAQAGLHHLGKRPALGVFRGDLEITADVVGDQFAHVGRIADGQVVAHPGRDQDFLDARLFPRLAVQLDQRRMIGVHVDANVRVDAGQLATVLLDVARLAGQPVHVGGRPAEVGNDSGEARCLVANLLDLAQDRGFRTGLNDAAFVFGDRAEGATAEAAAHDVDREANHFPGRDAGVAIARMRRAGVGQIEHGVEFRGSQRNRRRVQPQVAVAVALNQGASVARVGLQMQQAGSVRVQHGVRFDLFVTRQADDGLGAVMTNGARVEAQRFRR